MLGAAALGRMFLGNQQSGGENWADDIKRTWGEHLAGFTKNELTRGLAAVSELKFPPTLPEFKRLCRPALDPEVAWWEADHCLRQRADGFMGDWTHPAVWRAGRAMSMEIRGGEFAKHRVRWTVLLKRELAKGFGEGIDPIDKRLAPPEPKATRPPTEEEKQRIEALRSRIRAEATPLSPSETATAFVTPDELMATVAAAQAGMGMEKP